VRILDQLADAHPEEPSLEDFVKRTRVLPQYCLRSTAPGAPTLIDKPCGRFHGKGSIPGDTITSDPGRAMITGKWADIGKFKPPILRGLAVRSPYFHGSAADSTVSIIDFYNARFNIGLSQNEKNDLVRFVEAR
jgi:cytochrome c peroxidase